ncbi:helix-turn-helix domain-containing protein [Spirosoma arboris]|nr:helix-turn-helix transcriptional regulator [Spirosoma arboris]
MDLKRDTGKLIREIRKKKGMTQGDLSQALGITKQSFGRYENGTANLSLDTIQKVAESLEVKVRIIFE